MPDSCAIARAASSGATLGDCNAASSFGGAIVTVPHKTAIVPLLDAVSDAARLVGAVVTVERAIEHGSGRVTLGDGAWPARGPELTAGARARVVAIDGGVLVVEPLDDVITSSPRT